MKRIMALCMITFLTIIITNSCSDKEVKIGLLMADYIQMRWRRDKDLFVKRANEKGAKVLVEVGRPQAEYLTNICPQGNFAIIGGATTDNNSVLLKIGQMNVLQPFVERGDINIIYDQFVDSWTQEEGYNHMMKCLNNGNVKVDAVITANDDLATGVIKALEEINTDKTVYLAGQDADLAACKRIVSGTRSQ
jgi:D-xylose transport system substrate-binding protein